MIDIPAILGEFGIDAKKSGKNVGSNDWNIDCPYCGADKHLGINVRDGRVFCWVCEFSDAKITIGDSERNPSLIDVLVEITGERWIDVKNVLDENGWEEFYPKKRLNETEIRCKLPFGWYNFGESGSEKADFYLERRGFTPGIIDKYKLVIAPSTGFYANRIIIPIFYNGEIVAFTGRDYTGKQERYKHSTVNNSNRRIKELLYNYDMAKNFKHIYLLEGPTDVWRMGDDAVAVFRSHLSAEQRRLLINLSLDSITIIYDPKATMRAYMAAEDLRPFIKRIKVVRLEGIRDVGDMSRDEVLAYEKETRYFS